MNATTFFLFLLVCTTLILIDARTMWGTRRKKDNDDEKQHVSTKKEGILHKRNGRSSDSNRIAPQVNNDVQMEQFFDSFMKKIEEVIDSNDFASMINSDSAKTILDQIASINPDSKELFDNINWEDFDTEDFRRTFKEGIQLAKQNFGEILQVLNDPVTLNNYLEALPEEVRDILSSLKSGDAGSLMKLVKDYTGDYTAQ